MGNTSNDYTTYYNIVRQKEAEYLEAIQSAATITNGERRARISSLSTMKKLKHGVESIECL